MKYQLIEIIRIKGKEKIIEIIIKEVIKILM